MNVMHFMSDEIFNLASQIRRQLMENQPVDQPYEQRLFRKNGTEAILKLTTSLVTEDGTPTGFHHIARDITEERRMQDNLRYYLQEITRSQEEERKRIARELHDDTAQALHALSRQVDNFIRSNTNLPADNAAFLRDLNEQVGEVLQGVRRFGQDLRPPMLDDLGLLATLRWLVREMKEKHGIDADLILHGIERRLPAEIELTLFRIAQEALRNVEKHAEASKVVVNIGFDEVKAKISVSDDGRGFELPGSLGDLARIGKLGLAGMEERARLLGGGMKIESEPGKGTTIVIEAPI
jgi:signal transduction histidine kinase